MGIYKEDGGNIKVDNEYVYENNRIKENIFYIQDEVYFPRNATVEYSANYYREFYPKFDMAKFNEFMQKLDFEKQRKINTFSKGMKKQLSIMLALSANTKYIVMDETFDGLDPSMRQVVKSLIVQFMENNNSTVLIASHNLREIEDICDCVGLIHKGGVLLNKDISNMKLEICKIQCAFEGPMDIHTLNNLNINIISHNVRGSLFTLIIKYDENYALDKIRKLNPVFLESLPLTLEEIFITETEVVGYDIKKLII